MTENSAVGGLVIPLSGEEIEISRKIVAGETVRVSSVTRHSEQLVDESLVQERIEISHIPKGYEIDAAPEIIQDDELIIIPVVEEILVLQRRLILKKEVHVRRVRTVIQHRETVPLRHQEAVIERVPPAGKEDFSTPPSLNSHPKEQS